MRSKDCDATACSARRSRFRGRRARAHPEQQRAHPGHDGAAASKEPDALRGRKAERELFNLPASMRCSRRPGRSRRRRGPAMEPKAGVARWRRGQRPRKALRSRAGAESGLASRKARWHALFFVFLGGSARSSVLIFFFSSWRSGWGPRRAAREAGRKARESDAEKARSKAEEARRAANESAAR